MPNDYTFNGQRPGEKVREVINNHPYVFYPSGLRTILMIALGLVIILFLPGFYLASIVIFVLAAIFFFRAFYCYKESIFIITNQRLFSIEQKGFFKRKITEVEMDRIQDMSSDTEGFTRTFLKYGDLIIRTAGGGADSGNIRIKNIPNPYDIQQIVARIRSQVER